MYSGRHRPRSEQECGASCKGVPSEETPRRRGRRPHREWAHLPQRSMHLPYPPKSPSLSLFVSCPQQKCRPSLGASPFPTMSPRAPPLFCFTAVSLHLGLQKDCQAPKVNRLRPLDFVALNRNVSLVDNEGMFGETQQDATAHSGSDNSTRSLCDLRKKKTVGHHTPH